MKKIFLHTKSVITVLAFFISINSFSQLDPNSSSGGDPDPDAPIDGGISLLIAAGAAAGARKIYKNKKENKVSDI